MGKRIGLWPALAAIGMIVVLFAAACGTPDPEIIEVEKQVVVEKEVVKEVPVEVIVKEEVVKEVAVERVVVKEVPVEKIVKEVVEVEKEVVKEVPVEVVVKEEVIREVEVEKVVTMEVVKEVRVPVIQFVEVTPVPDAMPFARLGEAPILAQKVAAGKLAPVADRLPKDPLVLPVQEIGRYGGTIRRAFKGPSDWPNYIRISRTGLVRYTSDGTAIMPGIAKGWEASDGGKVWTFYLREGMKWSDGAPFTADDFVFQYEDVILNEELAPTNPTQLVVGGELAKIEKVGDYAVKISFAAPNYVFPEVVAQMDYGFCCLTNMLFTPAHYMKQFHIKYNPDANDEAKAEGLESWTQLYTNRFDQRINPEMPDVRPWVLSNRHSSQVMVAERNPYYYAVDPEGNQLPYIDRLEFTQFESLETLTLRALAGEVDFQARHILMGDFPVLKENEAEGGYKVLLWPADAADLLLYFNQSYQGPEAEFLTNKKFRQALSVAINREEINEISILGLGTPRQMVPPPGHDYYPGDDHAFKYTGYDPALAAQWLDEILPNKDSEGFRLMPNGERLNIVLTTAPIFGPWVDIGEQVGRAWEAVGVKTKVDVVTRSLLQTRSDGNEAMVTTMSQGRTSFIFSVPDETSPIWYRSFIGPAYGAWHASNGTDGIEPPTEMKELIDLHLQGVTVPPDEAAEVGKEIFRRHTENLWIIGITGLSPMSSGVVVVNADLRNVPDVAANSWPMRAPSTSFPETFFYR